MKINTPTLALSLLLLVMLIWCAALIGFSDGGDLQLSDPGRKWAVAKSLLLFAVAFLIAWTPSLLVRYVFGEPGTRWAGLIVAAVTFCLGMVAGALLIGSERPGIDKLGIAVAVCAYLTVTRKGTREE